MDGLVENANKAYFFFSLIIFALSIYLGVLVSKIRRNSQQIESRANEIDKQIEERAVYYKESIIIICKATIQKQCELSEACIRIKKILEYFPSIEKNNDYKVFQEMYNEIKDFPTHAARNELSKKEIFGQDQRRLKIEQKYQEKMLVGLKVLQNQFESLM